MKNAKNTLMFQSILFMFMIWGFAALFNTGYIPAGLDLFIFLMIIVAGVYAFVVNMRKFKDEEAGFPAEDELSTRIKYKAGYYAFIGSLYMWLFLFLFKSFIPDVETLVGGGILLSSIGFMVIKGYMERNYDEN